MSHNRLWILAHQDDEVLGLHLRTESINNYVVYLTDGVRQGAHYDSNLRSAEARNAWRKIDEDTELIFYGTDNAIKDGELSKQLNASHLNDLASICRSRRIYEIVTLQLEGGHQDHDVTSLISEELSRRLSLQFVTFPAYRALHEKYPAYKVMSSKTQPLDSIPRTAATRLRDSKRALSLMRSYKSQLSTWVGLGPFVFLKYLFGKPTYSLQPGSNLNPQELPTKLLYSIRNKYEVLNYEEIRKNMSGWIIS